MKRHNAKPTKAERIQLALSPLPATSAMASIAVEPEAQREAVWNLLPRSHSMVTHVSPFSMMCRFHIVSLFLHFIFCMCVHIVLCMFYAFNLFLHSEA
jgi:hypothetical protein